MPKIKSKSLFIFFLTVAIIFSLVAMVNAKADPNPKRNQGQNQEIEEHNNQNTSTINATSEEEDEEENEENATNSKGQINAAEHRSVVANFVQGLLKVADREKGGIGEQVRVIAQQQNQSDATATEAINKIQNRSKIKTFLIGSDYKNLGALRSEVVHTRNRLDQLNRLLPTVQNASDTVEIQNQIQTLEQEQTKIENFIKTQEGKFSLFGWLFKLFNR